MSLKQYQMFKIVLVFVTAFVYSQTVIQRNFIIPIAVMISSALVLMLLRKKVKGVIADERDKVVGGSSAFLAMQLYGWAAAISMFVLFAFRDRNPVYEVVGLTLAYSTCVLIVLYSIIFKIKIRAV